MDYADKENNILHRSYITRHLGFLATDDQESINYFKDSLEIRQKEQSIVNVPFSLRSLGDAYKKAGDNDQALANLEEAYDTAMKIDTGAT